jgi:hypothetical protein
VRALVRPESVAPVSRGAGVSALEGEVLGAGLFLEVDVFLVFVIGASLEEDFRKEFMGLGSLDERSPWGGLTSLIGVKASF